MTIVDVIKSKNNLISGTPATREMISAAESVLGLSFSEDYREYLRAFGVVTFDGHALTGIWPGSHLNVTTITDELRELYPSVPSNCYVVEDAYIDGIVIWQDQNGIVYQATPDSDPITIANSLADYIQDN